MSSENQAKPNGKDSKDLPLEKSLLEIYNMLVMGGSNGTAGFEHQWIPTITFHCRILYGRGKNKVNTH
jgi:hypothetical protein